MNKEPDWSSSETLLSEPWKNPLTPMDERLVIADGAVAFLNGVINNLRAQLEEAMKDVARVDHMAETRTAVASSDFIWQAINKKTNDVVRYAIKNGSGKPEQVKDPKLAIREALDQSIENWR